MENKVTITEVAKEAGVALGTASRVLNNHPSVNQEARLKVLEAAKRLNYVRLRRRRQRAGRGGEGKPQGNIGVILLGLDQTFVHLPITTEMVQGVERQITQMNRNMLLANIPRLDRVPAFLSEMQVEGLILRSPLVGSLPSPEENAFVRQMSRFPAVWLMGKPENAPGDVCGYDTAHATLLAVKHFLAKGHQQVAFLNPRPGNLLIEQLKKHFFFTAEKQGLKVVLLEKKKKQQDEWPLPAIMDTANIRPLLEKWAALPDGQRPTGIFVGADSAAVQIYYALGDMGMRVGKDVSIISCNNEKPLVVGLNPALTTIDIFSETIGMRAVDQLVWRLQHPDVVQAMRVLVEPRLIEGSSVADLTQ